MIIESMDIELSADRRAAAYAAMGDPGRLAVVDALAVGDASPGELARQLGIGSNLLAHHLNVLQQAGLVRRLRSDGDRRRTYVTLVPDVLKGLSIGTERTAPRVVFICTGNSARSQLAAALWSQRSRIPATSGGTQPAPHIHPGAIAVARRRGLPMRNRRPRHFDDVARADDLVVAVCDRAHEELGTLERLHWSIPDPVRAGTDAAFNAVVDRLDTRVADLARFLNPSTTMPTRTTPTTASSRENSEILL